MLAAALERNAPTVAYRWAKAEMDRRVLIDSGDRTEVVIAELGTWAGAIGAAVHGAEQAARRGLIELSA